MAEKIIKRDIVHDSSRGYLEYAMDVIIGRALPDVRDGCKPVHRRIIHSMNETNNTYKNAYRKCARTVGDVLGKYHPHGDSSVYDAMVRLAQPFSLRYPLIDGHGNFGSVDGDSAAAMRYTEARGSKLLDVMVQDIEKETVDMMRNYDETLWEPTVLPSAIPNMLVNGGEGIAVGFASKMPTHNLGEVLEGIIAKIDNPELDSIGLMKYIKGPDFPLGGTIMGTTGIVNAYTTGKGQITIRADYVIEDIKNGKQQIVFTNIPYQVNKSKSVERIAQLIKEDEIKNVVEVRDESSEKDGIRIVIEMKRAANPAQIVNIIYKKTELQSNFNVNMTALLTKKNGKLVPHLFTLEELVREYIKHRKSVTTRKYQFLLAKAKARDHILEGLLKALDQIEEVIATIRASHDKEDARINLCQKFGFDDLQANAILAYQLHRLSGLEITKVKEEREEILRNIAEYNHILSSDQTISEEVKRDCKTMLNQFGDDRITKIGNAIKQTSDDEVDETVPDKEMVVTITNTGYIKSIPLEEFNSQGRGGKGSKGGIKNADLDVITQIMSINKRNVLLCVGDNGRVYRLKVDEINEVSKTSTGRGQYLNALIEAENDVTIVSVIGLDIKTKSQGSLLFFTRNGGIKRIAMEDLITNRRSVIAIKIAEDDEVVTASRAIEDEGFAFVATHNGRLMKFEYGRFKCKGRNAGSQKLIKVSDGDFVINAGLVDENKAILTVTNTGMAKKTLASEYGIKASGQGVTNYKTDKKTFVASVIEISDTDDILVACDNGKLIRVHADTINDKGRTAKGVKLITLEENESVTCVNAVPRQDEDGNIITDTTLENKEDSVAETEEDENNTTPTTDDGQTSLF